jgi:hypothetical protein
VRRTVSSMNAGSSEDHRQAPAFSTRALSSDDDAQRANDAWTGSWPKEGTNHLDPLHAVWLTLARIGSDEPAAARWY